MENEDCAHDTYLNACGIWQKARDVVAGEDAIKAGGTAYVPKLSDETPEEYRARVMRGCFFGATSRTLDGLSGLIFRKPTQFVLPDLMNDFANDCKMEGVNLPDYCKALAEEILATGRGGTLVDWNEKQKRPHFVYYSAENILNWESRWIGGRNQVVKVVLREYAPPRLAQPKPDASSRVKVTTGRRRQEDLPEEAEVPAKVAQLRIITLEELGNTFACTVNLLQKNIQKKWETVETMTPKRRGTALDFIPFVFHGTKNSSPDIAKPPLADMIHVNLDHFRLDVDYKHGLHFCGLPTAWVAGFSTDTVFTIGSSRAWVSTDVNAKAGFLEFTGQGLNPLKEALESDERKMAVLGARLLEQQKREAETAEAMALRQGGEASALTNIANAVSQGVTTATKIAFWWIGTEASVDRIKDDVCAVMVNKDFISSRMAAADLVALVAAWQKMAISHDTLLDNLRQGEIISEKVSNDDELARIEATPPGIAPLDEAKLEAGKEKAAASAAAKKKAAAKKPAK